jgi:hypothetical protein
MYQLPGTLVAINADDSRVVEVYMGKESFLFTVPVASSVFPDVSQADVGDCLTCAVKLRGTRGKLVAVLA